MYSGTVYGQICGQIQVPNDSHVVISFGGGRSTRKLLHRWRKNVWRVEKKHTNRYMWSNSYREMITMWSGTAEDGWSSFCRCCIVTLVKGFVKPFRDLFATRRSDTTSLTQYTASVIAVCKSLPNKISTQNLIRSKQRKSKSRSSPSCRRKASVHAWWRWSHFCFWVYQ